MSVRLWSTVASLLVGGLILASAGAVGAAGAKVPEVVVGPDVAETSARVEAAIVEVTVYSDRARVRRRGRAIMKAGAGVLRLPDLPGGAYLDTVRVGAVGGRVLRVEAVPIERERLEIEQATKALDALDAVDDRLAALDDRAGVERWEVDAVNRLRPAAPVPEDKREGRKGLAVDVASWWKALDFLGERALAARTRLARVADERRQLEAERDGLRAEVAKLNRGGFSDRLVQVIAVVEPASAGPVQVELEYFVPGAWWKPAYNLYFSSARGQLTLETTAVVQQSSGEDWPQAALSFSTATPGQGIELPELLTWTLGERSEFVPVLRPRKPPRVEPLLPMPRAESAASAAHAIAGELVRQRLARAAIAPSRALAASESASVEDRDRTAAKTEIKDLVAEALSDRAPLSRSRPRRDSDDDSEGGEAPRTVQRTAQATGSPLRAMQERRAYTQSAPASLESEESSSPSWADVVAVPQKWTKKASASASAARTWSMPLSLVDATAPRPPPIFTDPLLPAVTGGGLDYVYRSPTPATVESSGKEARIPLASQTFHTAAFYEATPGLAATAFLRARVRNDGKRPLLRGPATIFGDGELVGQGEIQTTGPSGTIELPLGADQDLRLVRQIVRSSKTTGLIMKSEETVYDVQIQIGNYKKQAVTVEVIDQVPMSRNDDIQVKLLATDPAPVGPQDLDGVLRWRVALPAGETRTVKLRYQITRPKDWKLYQR